MILSHCQSLLEFANRLARGLLDNRGKIGFAERRMICVGAEIWYVSLASYIYLMTSSRHDSYLLNTSYTKQGWLDHGCQGL